MEKGVKLMNRRQQLGMNQQGLASLIDVAMSTISRIETGKGAASRKVLIRLCHALKIDIETLEPNDMASAFDEFPRDLLSSRDHLEYYPRSLIDQWKRKYEDELKRIPKK